MHGFFAQTNDVPWFMNSKLQINFLIGLFFAQRNLPYFIPTFKVNRG